MSVWVDLVVREAIFLVVLVALGSGPAAFLGVPRSARLALAPVFGLCVGCCASVTMVRFVSARHTGWAILALALASVAVAVWRLKPGVGRVRARRVAQLALIVVLIPTSLNVPLALRHTVGPEGGYHIADTAGYVSTSNSEARESIRTALRQHGPIADLAVGYWVGYAQRDQQLDVTALEANLNSTMGLGATDTQSPFLICIVLVGALGAYGVVREMGDRRGWGATFAAGLFAGPLMAELFADGSQAAISGATLMAPIALLGVDAVQHRRRSSLVLLALLLAGLETIYPLFLPSVVIAAAGALALLTARRLRRGLPSRQEALGALAALATVVVLCVVFTPVAFSRDAHYWLSLLNGSFSLSGLPAYTLPVSVLPGWILQTQEFYGLMGVMHSSFGRLLLNALLPLALLVPIGFAVRRYRTAQMMLGIALGAILLALYTGAGRGCSYCVQRNLLPIAPLGAVAIGAGLVIAAGCRRRFALASALALALATLAATYDQGVIERQRLANGSYLLETQDRQAIAALPGRPGYVELEGFGQGPLAPMEEPLVYNLVDERTDGRLSVPTYIDDRRGLLYLGGVQPLGPSFHSNYDFVLTRVAGVRTNRKVVARHGPIALERRTTGLDVTVTGGVAVAAARRDPAGEAWVSGPLHFLVLGGRTAQPAWLTLVLARTVPVSVKPTLGVARAVAGPGTLRICMRALGTAPIRSADVQVNFTPQPPPPTTEPYADPLPARGVRLVAMTVSSRSCAGRG